MTTRNQNKKVCTTSKKAPIKEMLAPSILSEYSDDEKENVAPIQIKTTARKTKKVLEESDDEPDQYVVVKMKIDLRDISFRNVECKAGLMIVAELKKGDNKKPFYIGHLWKSGKEKAFVSNKLFNEINLLSLYEESL